MSPVVRMIGVCKHFGKGEALVRAVDSLDFEVSEGEAVMVTGPSGCGKSTLLQLMGGLDLPTAGEVWVGGRRIDRTSERARARLRREHVGFVFQDFHLMDELTALENVELPALLAGTSTGRARRRASALLEEMGLADRGHHRPAQLSGGQKQRVAIARAVVNRPTVLLADEPTGNLDSVATTEVLRLFDTLRANGQTLVVVTHDQRTAATAERIVSLRDGAIVEDHILAPSTVNAADLLSGEALT
ncbi:MAG TPA: ABC transporter ATP-binding protein [Nocardioides sp.]|jgi:putative ABC transport system ATP-binding protein|uniref:ABC transporter ATP-binding protein n=1 Tax=Nocardioides sp. TaxID=35761 RepID=UPI002E362598|nr:ABC transporter ATP-binding protein [Nocardioides sp.]HEX3930102.1 ABC transporter ATP-binding protein [Nocardioides sp.]